MEERKRTSVRMQSRNYTDDVVRAETNKAIRRILEVLENHTNLLELESDRKAVVRDTVLNQINKLARIIKHKQTMIFEQKE